jgi:hypothetical protein
LVEQLIRNEKVEGSTPFSGTNSSAERRKRKPTSGSAFSFPRLFGNGRSTAASRLLVSFDRHVQPQSHPIAAFAEQEDRDGRNRVDSVTTDSANCAFH